uniref:Type I restriction-modification system specificity subunit n=1 Tax=Lactococcus lactis subsp. lactis bv. diacetylactis TaxID=44688 RepID=G1FE35_LACLL|nr:restriction endonuclease subunit S [Lactococcus lactis]AEK97254.1 type I restriction-modification system specificity subunit [Lactococcus lactis subsp. lactis bv. diacetylactis]
MMSKKSPQLRFEGFTDDWEERKLSNVVSLLGGNAFKSKDSVTEEGVRWLKIANVSNSGIKWNEESFLPSDYWERYPNYRIVAGDYVMALTRPIIAHELKIAKMPLGSNALLNQRVAKLIWNMNADFGFQLLRKRNVVDYIEQTISGTDPPNLSGNTFEKIMVSVPKTVEQEKIGRFLETVDNLLAVNQRKLDLLKEQKKGYLQKMFPKNGVKVPELRFAGFADDWEERKFKDNIVSIQTGTNLLGSAANEGTPLIKMGNLQRGYFSFKKLEYLDSNSNVGSEDIVNYGDFLFNTRNTLELVGKGATWTGISGKYAFNSNIARFKFDGIDTIFFNYLYNTQQVISQVHARAVGTTSVSAVYPRDLNSLLYYLPSLEEQQKIGSFFKQLDKTIALHQRKLDLLKEQKKGFLQKMFV